LTTDEYCFSGVSIRHLCDRLLSLLHSRIWKLPDFWPMQWNSIDRQVCHMKRWQQRSKLIVFWNFHVGSLHLTFWRWAIKFQINTITRYYWKATDNASQYITSTPLCSSLLYHHIATIYKFNGISILWDIVFIPISANLHSQKPNLFGGGEEINSLHSSI
jgi:hypothetical protein